MPVFNHRKIDLAMRVWDNRQARLEAALHRVRHGGSRPLMKVKGSKDKVVRVFCRVVRSLVSRHAAP